MIEEVSIWASPVRTSGLLSMTFSSRHLTTLSGKFTEEIQNDILISLSALTSLWQKYLAHLLIYTWNADFYQPFYCYINGNCLIQLGFCNENGGYEMGTCNDFISNFGFLGVRIDIFSLEVTSFPFPLDSNFSSNFGFMIFFSRVWLWYYA